MLTKSFAKQRSMSSRKYLSLSLRNVFPFLSVSFSPLSFVLFFLFVCYPQTDFDVPQAIWDGHRGSAQAAQQYGAALATRPDVVEAERKAREEREREFIERSIGPTLPGESKPGELQASYNNRPPQPPPVALPPPPPQPRQAAAPPPLPPQQQPPLMPVKPLLPPQRPQLPKFIFCLFVCLLFLSFF